MLPVLSGDGSLSFPDTESIVAACAQLRKGGNFEAQVQGAPAAGLVRLLIRLPDSQVPIVHTAAVRVAGPGRMTIGMSGAAAVLERLERATGAAKPAAPRLPRAETPPTPTTDSITAPRAPRSTMPHPMPRPAPTRDVPSRPTGPRQVVSLADLDPMPPLDDLPPPPPPTPRPVAARATASMPAPASPPVAGPPRPIVRDAPRAPAPRIDLKGLLARQPRAGDLRALFDGTIDRSSLATTHLADLVRFLTSARATGRLRLVGPCTKTFWFCDGDYGPSEADPPPPEELIGHLVIKMGRLTSSAPVDEAVRIARKSGRRTGEVLVERGLLDASQLPNLLRAQTEARLVHASEWSSAEYEFSSVPFPAGAPRLGALRAHVALARHVVGRAAAQELHTHFAALESLYARLAPLADVEEVALIGDARAAHTLRRAFPGTHRLRDALSACPLGKLPTLRLLALVEAYGVLETDAAQLVMTGGANAAGALRHRVMQTRGHGPFRRLGAHAAMPLDQIREAYARTTGDCAPGGPWERIDPEASRAMAALLDEAFRSLHDGDDRARCRRDFLGPERSRFVADLLCAHARALRSRGDAQHARAAAEVSLELHDSPEARELVAGT